MKVERRKRKDWIWRRIGFFVALFWVTLSLSASGMSEESENMIEPDVPIEAAVHTRLNDSPIGAFESLEVVLGNVDSSLGTLSFRFRGKVAPAAGKGEEWYEALIEAYEMEAAGISPEEWLNNMTDAERAAWEMEPVTFTFVLKETSAQFLDIPDGIVEIKTSNGEVLGHYIWERDENGNDCCMVEFLPFIYLKSSVEFSFSVPLGLKENVTVDDTPSLEYVEEENVWNIKGLQKETEVSQEPVYEISKSAPESISSPNLDYTIAARAVEGEEGLLSGLLIKDTLLRTTLLSVDVSLDGSEPRLLSEGADYTWENGVFVYRVPEKSSGGTDSGGFSTCTLILHTAISGETYAAYVRGEAQEPIANQAYLLTGEPDETAEELACSKEVQTQIDTGSFFVKEGRVSFYNTRLVDWTLKINSRPAASMGVFVIDRLDASINSYTGNVSVNGHVYTVGGSPYAIVDLYGENLPSYETLTNANVEQVTENGRYILQLGDFTVDSEDTIVYRYTLGEEAVLIIPFSRYMGQESTVSYQTELDRSLPVGGTYQMDNVAKLIWQISMFPGEEEGDFDVDLDARVVKTPSASQNLLEKLNAGYDAVEGVQKWRFDLNPCCVLLNNILIEDEFFCDSQVPALAEDVELLLTARDGSGSISIPRMEPEAFQQMMEDGTETGGYTIVWTPDINESGAHVHGVFTVRIWLKEVDKSYTFELPARIMAADQMLNQQEKPVLRNTAFYTAQVNGAETVSGSVGPVLSVIDHSLIQKEAVQGSFCYDDFSFEWQMKVNPDYLPMINLQITDYLPLGTVLSEIVSVERVHPGETQGIMGERDEDTITGAVWHWDDGIRMILSDVTEEKRAAVVEDGTSYLANSFRLLVDHPMPCRDCFIITFRMAYRDEQYRRNYFDRAESGNDTQSLAIVNRVQVTGGTLQYDDSHSAEISEPYPEAEGRALLELPVLSKSGQYLANEDYYYDGTLLPGASYVLWSAVINKNRTDFGGAKVEDMLPYFFTLDQNSIHFYEADVNAAGTAYIKGESIDRVEFEDLYTSSDGFSFTVPKNRGKETFIVEFVTLLSDDAAGYQMVNTIRMQRENDRLQGSSGQITQDNFAMEDHFYMDRLPYIRIVKTAAGSETPVYLAGAEFELVQVDGELQPIAGTAATRVTKENGTAIFTFLSRNILYRLTETRAPEGYLPDSTPYYFVFVEEGSGMVYLPQVLQIADNNAGIQFVNQLLEGPMEPEDPENPIEPEEPTGPEKPTDPNAPADPEFTTNPENPTNPEGSGEPETRPIPNDQPTAEPDVTVTNVPNNDPESGRVAPQTADTVYGEIQWIQIILWTVLLCMIVSLSAKKEE